jgi:N-acyl amino acid synthase of PEP-CTERM/exosortase system
MFDERFEAFLADTPRGRQLHYRIRYEVYCRETGFEDARLFPRREEQDHYDAHAHHFLVRHTVTGEWVAAMRLVLPQAGRLPFQDVCPMAADATAGLSTADAAEVSRLCMVEGLRRRGYERSFPYQMVDRSNEKVTELRRRERRLGPQVLMGLLRAAYAYNRERLGFQQWYFLVSPALARVIGGAGIDLVPVGPSCEHRGVRAPYVSDVERSHRDVLASSPEMAEFFNGGPAYRKFSDLGYPEHELPVEHPWRDVSLRSASAG